MPKPRVNGKIRASEVRVIEYQGRQLGIMRLTDALKAAKLRGIDLVEIASTAKPPICCLMDYGEYLSAHTKKVKRKKR